jgi:NAD(P)H-hydrate epimerase
MTKETKDVLKDIYKERKKGVYYRKYDFGFLLVIGGSDYYCGSPALSAMAAFKTGVDMVRILAPERAADIIASFSPNLATYSLDGKWLEKKHLPTLIAMTESAKEVSRGNVAVVIGGGMGRTKETQETILEYLEKVSVPVVIDADAIYALSDNPGIIKGKGFLITPHSYEFFVLTKREIFKLPHSEKIEVVKEEAQRLGTTILLKEKPDIISDGKEVALNKTGSPYMSVGGTGDALAGICGALLSRKDIGPFLAGQVGAYISGKAGELAAKKLKDSLVATDVIEAIPEVLH